MTKKYFARRSRSALVVVFGVALTLMPLGSTAAASEQTGGRDQDRIARWIRQHASPIDTVNPEASLHDLASLREAIGDATVVGLGESVHGAREQIKLKHRTLRFLVEELGFRSVAWEEDWTTGLRIDAFLRSGRGDLDALVSRMSDQWHSKEVKQVLRWLRRYNSNHRHDVRFVGVDYYYTGRLAYDALERYIARVAPDRLNDAQRHLRVVRPFTRDMRKYYEWYVGKRDKAPYVRHARRLFEILRGIAPQPGDRERAMMLHHARQIVSYYENFRLEGNAAFDYREAHAARNLRWWERFSGDKVAYWAASTHVMRAPHLRVVLPSYPDIEFETSGSFLRRFYGQHYVPVGFSIDHGRVRTGPTSSMAMALPAADWLEHPFGNAPRAAFIVDLRAPAPPAVRDWLHSPTRTRGFGGGGTNTYLTGGTAIDWFDIIIHRQVDTPTRFAP